MSGFKPETRIYRVSKLFLPRKSLIICFFFIFSQYYHFYEIKITLFYWILGMILENVFREEKLFLQEICKYIVNFH